MSTDTPSFSGMDVLKALNLHGFVHVWGSSGSGKTLFAMQAAATRSIESHVVWICTDLKTSFIPRLKELVDYHKGTASNITVIITRGSQETYETLLGLEHILLPATSLVIIDSLTRVLDMARRDPILWGREMVEDILPYLAGLASSKQLSLLCTSECRTLDLTGAKPVFHKTIQKWVNCEIRLSRPHGAKISEIIHTQNDECIALQKIHVSGVPEITVDMQQKKSKEVPICSEEQSCA